ncbi:MAG: diguanylate cyclase [Deltaproteobacteria bacterium]|nr:diguanylate cyclase [Deltaproteobacteria bacterium]
MSQTPVETPSTVAVLDIEKHGGRRLSDTVRGTGLTPLQYRNLDDFTQALEDGDALIGMVAFECLWPDPQKTLRSLKDKAGNAKLLVVYSEGAPRWRLGQRLWSIGLFDFYTPRSTPPHEMRPILRQAWADALVDSAPLAEMENGDSGLGELHRRIRSLSTLGAAFAGQQQTEGLLRELQTRLPQLLDFNLLEVLVVGDDEKPRMFVSQTRPVDHEDIWALAETICASVKPLTDSTLTPETLVWEGNAPIRPVSSGSTGGDDVASLAFPMVIGGELVGCMGLQLPGDTDGLVESRTTLQIIASQLGTSLRSAQILEAAESEALTDELTGAFNRRYLNRVLDTEWKRAERYDLELSVALIDIDHFKRINDRYGHLAGDEVLVNLVSELNDQVREIDHVVRYGGEEFLILLPQTGPSEAMMVLERIREHIARTVLYESTELGPLQVTVSAGISAFPTTAASSPEHLIEFADEALYESKRGGRNQVTVSSGRSTKHGATVSPRPDGDDRRQFPRIDAEMSVRFISLPGVDGQVVRLDTTDVSAGGICVRGPKKELRLNSLALVYIGEQERPMLARVVWTRTSDSGDYLAGLRFVSVRDISSRHPVDRAGQRALVICDLPKTRSQVQRVLRATQCVTDVVLDDDSPLLEQDNLSRYSLFVVGESKLRGDLGGHLKALRKNPNVRIVVINEGGDRREALGTIHTEKVEHLVPSPAAEEALFATLNKLLLGEYFGIKKYLLWGAVTNSWRLERSDQKQEVLDGIVAMAKEVKCHPRIIDSLVQAVDEMIINALFRPVEEGETGKHSVTVECGSDGRLLAVGVVDEHGRLKREDIFEGIGAALESETKGIPEGASHAHLGFRIMLDALSQLSVNVDPGRCTEIIGIVDLRRSLREHRAAVPGLGLFRT